MFEITNIESGLASKNNWISWNSALLDLNISIIFSKLFPAAYLNSIRNKWLKIVPMP